MSGHLDGPPPGPPDPSYIPGDLGAPSAEEFARRRGQAATFDPRHPHEPEIPPAPDEEAIRCDERERLSARVYENGWCPTCAHKADPDAMPPHEVAAILVDPAEVLSPEEVAEYERCQQSVIDARRRAPMVEGQMIVGAAATPDERLREAVAALPQYVITIQDREGYTYERGCAGQPMNYTGVLLADVEALIGELKDGAPVTRETTDELKDALREIASFDACGDARSDYRDVIRVKEIAAAALAAADREKPETDT